jgi:type II secretory pathway component PulJ
MKRQAGVSLIGMLIVASLAAFFLLLAFRSVPAYSEYFAVKKILNAMVKEASKETTVTQLRKDFEKRAYIDYVETVGPEDLIVSKEGGNIVLSVEYERRVPVAGNVYLLFEFNPTTSGKSAAAAAD